MPTGLLAVLVLGLVATSAAQRPDRGPVVTGGCGFKRAAVEGNKQAASPNAPNPLAGEKWYVDTYRKQTGNRAYREPGYAVYRKASGKRKAAAGQDRAHASLRLVRRLHPGARAHLRLHPDGRGRQRRAADHHPATRGQGVQLQLHGWRRGGGQPHQALVRPGTGHGPSRAIIAFEPDSLGTIECLAPSRRKARLDLLRYGVDVLSKLPNATVYIEASASDWRPAKLMAQRLRYIGIHKVRGFMLNVTHFDWTAANIRYGMQISRLVGGKHFIVSTNHSGRGPVSYRSGRRVTVVNCHPKFRGLGPTPTTDTGNPRVDAFMWISRPGYSRGACNGPPRRAFWLARAWSWPSTPHSSSGPSRALGSAFPRGRFTLKRVAGDQLRR